MLWLKGWLETRLRLLIPFAGFLYVLYVGHKVPGGFRFERSPLMSVSFPLMWLLIPILVAGAGIKTESAFRARKGLNGSMYFTLALPVSRLRLFAVRIGLGMGEVVAMIVICCCIADCLPEIRAQATLGDGLRYAVTVFLCGLGYFGISTLLSTFLDQQWQSFGSLFVVGILSRLPQRLDIFRAMGQGSPLVTHVFPWPAIGAALGLAAACLFAAGMISRTTEY